MSEALWVAITGIILLKALMEQKFRSDAEQRALLWEQRWSLLVEKLAEKGVEFRYGDDGEVKP